MKLGLIRATLALSIMTQAGCGQTSFSGRAKSSGSAYGQNGLKPGDADAEGVAIKVPQPVNPFPDGKRLEWNLECEGQQNSGTTLVDTTIDGGGVFEVAGDVSYNIKFKGTHCEGVTPKKDILFLFDGSSSMSINDPLNNGSCGRLDTMKAIMASFGGGSGNRFGMISFSSGNQSRIISSGTFYDSEQALIASLTASNNNSPIEEIICDSNRIGTNYNTGFAAAETLISLESAKDAGAIVFFVSDGQPLFGQTGEAAALRMKAAGVVIGTVMVAGNEDILRDKLASRDSTNKPLHIKVANISELTTAITQLASQTIVSDILRYRPVGNDYWNVVSLFPTADTLVWEQLEIGFDKANYPDGIEVEYQYFMPDTTGKGTLKGTLTFSP